MLEFKSSIPPSHHHGSAASFRTTTISHIPITNRSSNKAPLLLRNGERIGSRRGFLDLSREASNWSKEAIPCVHRRVVAASGRISAGSQNKKCRILVILHVCALVKTAISILV